MKVALAWAFALAAAVGALLSAIVHERIAASDVGSEPKDRQLQDDNEEGDDDQVHFQLKMYWEEGYRYVNY
jgi:hypothetical protein